MFTTGCMLALFVGIEIVFCGKEFAPLTFIKWLCVIMETVYLAQQAARAHPKHSNIRGPDRKINDFSSGIAFSVVPSLLLGPLKGFLRSRGALQGPLPQALLLELPIYTDTAEKN